MATEITTRPEPDEAFLVFKRRGAAGMPDLTPGSRLTITSLEDPTQSIVAEVATPREVVLSGGVSPDDFGSIFSQYSQYVPEFTWQRETQNFVILARDLDDSELPLTPRVLVETVLPIVVALASIQRMLFGTQPTIRGITQNSPVNVSLEGAGGLYEKIATDVIPWRRERAKQIAALEAAQRRAELEQKRAEVLGAEAKTLKERAEAEAASERARQARAEAGLKEVELTRARFQLALEMVESMFPNADGAERMNLVSQMMPELTRLTGSTEIVAGGSGSALPPLDPKIR